MYVAVSSYLFLLVVALGHREAASFPTDYVKLQGVGLKQETSGQYVTYSAKEIVPSYTTAETKKSASDVPEINENHYDQKRQEHVTEPVGSSEHKHEVNSGLNSGEDKNVQQKHPSAVSQSKQDPGAQAETSRSVSLEKGTGSAGVTKDDSQLSSGILRQDAETERHREEPRNAHDDELATQSSKPSMQTDPAFVFLSGSIQAQVTGNSPIYDDKPDCSLDQAGSLVHSIVTQKPALLDSEKKPKEEVTAREDTVNDARKLYARSDDDYSGLWRKMSSLLHLMNEKEDSVLSPSHETEGDDLGQFPNDLTTLTKRRVKRRVAKAKRSSSLHASGAVARHRQHKDRLQSAKTDEIRPGRDDRISSEVASRRAPG